MPRPIAIWPLFFNLREEAEAQSIPASRIICTGDVVAYCADPVETVAEIRDWGVAVVLGNCEESLAAGAADCGCGFAEGTVCDRLSRQWFDFSVAKLSADDKDWMASLPRRIDLTLDGIRLAAIHGGFSAINRYLFASTPEMKFTREHNLAGVDGVLAGHCGIPFTRMVGDRFWHNAGAPGMPANDARPDTWYALIDIVEGTGLKISHRCLAYDHLRAAQRMRDRGLAEGYARALETVIWPSFDVLTKLEREAAGQPIAIPDVMVKSSAPTH
jgi:predicted phosphodiesterase